MVKTFAQLKRDLKLGTKVQQIENEFWGSTNDSIREISIVQTNAIAFKTIKDGKEIASWLWYPKKASDVIYKGNVFTFMIHGKRISYQIIGGESNE